MIGLDTNVLLRYLISDDEVQGRKAEAMIGRLSLEAPAYVNTITLSEIAWVVESVFDYDRADTADLIERILQIDVLVVESEAEVFQAMAACRDGEADFADALIGVLNRSAGCTHTLTFDKKAARSSDFRLVD